MRRIALALVALLAPLAIPVGAAAATAPTISGPEAGRFWSMVTVSGHTDGAQRHVVVYYRRVDQDSATKSPVLTSDPDGAFSWSFRLAGKTHFWAKSDALNSAVHIVSLVQASCTVSGPAFTKLPFGNISEPDPDEVFGAFTANRSGIWTGYATDGAGDFAVIRWVAGSALRVVDRFSYHATYFVRSVDPVGVTPGGRIVAAVEDPTSVTSRLGLYWDQGVRHHLRMKPNWTQAWPVHVLDSGAVVGVGRQLDGSYVVATWPDVEAAPHWVATIGGGGSAYPQVMADDVGDIVWMRDLGRSSDVVRLRNGETRALAVPPFESPSLIPTAGGRYAVYGWGHGVVRWDFSNPPPSGPIMGAFRSGDDGGNAKATTAGWHGDIVVGDSRPRNLLTAAGAWVAVPQEADQFEDIGESIAADGTVAFTSHSDGRPHFLRCH